MRCVQSSSVKNFRSETPQGRSVMRVSCVGHALCSRMCREVELATTKGAYKARQMGGFAKKTEKKSKQHEISASATEMMIESAMRSGFNQQN